MVNVVVTTRIFELIAFMKPAMLVVLNGKGGADLLSFSSPLERHRITFRKLPGPNQDRNSATFDFPNLNRAAAKREFEAESIGNVVRTASAQRETSGTSQAQGPTVLQKDVRLDDTMKTVAACLEFELEIDGGSEGLVDGAPVCTSYGQPFIVPQMPSESFPQWQTLALDGAILFLVGPSGSGKTTLLDILLPESSAANDSRVAELADCWPTGEPACEVLRREWARGGFRLKWALDTLGTPSLGHRPFREHSEGERSLLAMLLVLASVQATAERGQEGGLGSHGTSSTFTSYEGSATAVLDEFLTVLSPRLWAGCCRVV